ncbi:MAG: hypothetical protein HY748_12370 [Elusimicrobia bacterium]|nr:hypothetical protein [Elusimicrobiota bacterium]
MGRRRLRPGPPGGRPQIFFSEELEKRPADFRGIIGKFADLQARPGGGGDHAGGGALIRLRPVVAGRLEAYSRWFAQADQDELLIDESVELAFNYRQEGYKLADCQGDVCLLVYTKEIPGAIGRQITGPGKTSLDKGRHRFEAVNPVLPPEPSRLPTAEAVLASDLPAEEVERLLVEIENGKLVIEGRLNPIKPQETKKMLTQVVAEETAKGLPPRYGTPHRWTNPKASPAPSSSTAARRWSSSEREASSRSMRISAVAVLALLPAAWPQRAHAGPEGGAFQAAEARGVRLERAAGSISGGARFRARRLAVLGRLLLEAEPRLPRGDEPGHQAPHQGRAGQDRRRAPGRDPLRARGASGRHPCHVLASVAALGCSRSPPWSWARDGGCAGAFEPGRRAGC